MLATSRTSSTSRSAGPHRRSPRSVRSSAAPRQGSSRPSRRRSSLRVRRRTVRFASSGRSPARPPSAWPLSSALPQVSQTDMFKQGASTKTETEIGPTLSSVLNPLGPLFTRPERRPELLCSWRRPPRTAPRSRLVGRDRREPECEPRPVLAGRRWTGIIVRDTGPRLTSPGDVAGGRYDFGVQLLNVFRAPSVAPVAGSGQNLPGANLNGAQLCRVITSWAQASRTPT